MYRKGRLNSIRIFEDIIIVYQDFEVQLLLCFIAAIGTKIEMKVETAGDAAANIV
jgi:hypothetical protein